MLAGITTWKLFGLCAKISVALSTHEIQFSHLNSDKDMSEILCELIIRIFNTYKGIRGKVSGTDLRSVDRGPSQVGTGV